MVNPVVGVLAIQGDVREHVLAVKAVKNTPSLPVRLIKTTGDLAGITHLIIPGGESTVVNKLGTTGSSASLFQTIKQRYEEEELCIFGTCAGAILVGAKIHNNSTNEMVPGLGLIDITVSRNAYGRQGDSFETQVEIKGLEPPTYHAVFIRAPKIVGANSRQVEILAKYNEAIVLVRSERILACTFHPELTPDTRLHQIFLSF